MIKTYCPSQGDKCQAPHQRVSHPEQFPSPWPEQLLRETSNGGECCVQCYFRNMDGFRRKIELLGSLELSHWWQGEEEYRQLHIRMMVQCIWEPIMLIWQVLSLQLICAMLASSMEQTPVRSPRILENRKNATQADLRSDLRSRAFQCFSTKVPERQSHDETFHDQWSEERVCGF